MKLAKTALFGIAVSSIMLIGKTSNAFICEDVLGWGSADGIDCNVQCNMAPEGANCESSGPAVQVDEGHWFCYCAPINRAPDTFLPNTVAPDQQ